MLLPVIVRVSRRPSPMSIVILGAGRTDFQWRMKLFRRYCADFLVRIKRRAEKSAVGAAILVGQLAQQTQREDRLPFAACGLLRGVEVGVPIKLRSVAIMLATHLVERCGQSGPELLPFERFTGRGDLGVGLLQMGRRGRGQFGAQCHLGGVLSDIGRVNGEQCLQTFGPGVAQSLDRSICRRRILRDRG